MGLSVTDIGSTLETFLGGRVVTDFKRGTKQYDVILQMKPELRSTPDAIENIYLRGTGGLVQLANVVKINKTVAPKELNHYNRVRSATITASLAPGVTLGKALDDLTGLHLKSFLQESSGIIPGSLLNINLQARLCILCSFLLLYLFI